MRTSTLRTLPFVLLVVAATAAIGSAAAEEYKGVVIAPESHSDTYKRSDYKHWSDFDSDRMQTRDEVLEEESLIAVEVVRKGRRIAVSVGLWADPYTGTVTTSPRALDVDHMVPLKEAHESGAWAWNAAKREQYANDMSNPNHLIAVDPRANRSKSDNDPADWMPPNRAYWCQYLASWLEVKRRWQLTMDQREAEAVERGERVCLLYTSRDHLDGRH
jgi:hypothetical protein